jgi:hypothetical protein
MNDIQILKRNPKKVLENLKLGEIEIIELAVDQMTDDFMIYGLRGGLIDELSSSFPDPRREEEITIKQILSASIAGHFQDMYAISQSPYALHSPVLLAELGLSVKVLSQGDGISRRGTKENAPFNGDVTRKMLNDVEPLELIRWYNRVVGAAYLRQADYKPCIHILDCTKLIVNFDNENYEGSGVVENEEGELERGYKLGSLRSLLDDGGIITAMAFGAIQVHDLTLCKDLLMTTPHLKSGDIVIEDMGFLDGKTISKLKKNRKVDVILPLRSDMKAYECALTTAYHEDSGSWEKHPTREKQEIKKVVRVDWMWEECKVPMHGCVVRQLKKDRDGSGGREDYEHWVFATTRLHLTGKQMIQTYQLRPEIEEDHRQWKEGTWDIAKFTSTRLIQVLYHVICVLLSYNLCEVYSNTQAGVEFAQKTLRQLKREQTRSHGVSMIVYSGDVYAVFDARFLIGLIIRLPQDVLHRLWPHFLVPKTGFG